MSIPLVSAAGHLSGVNDCVGWPISLVVHFHLSPFICAQVEMVVPLAQVL